MCFQLRDALKVGNIHLHSDFFSVQLDEREAIKLLRDELTRFAIVVEPAKTLFGKVCVCYAYYRIYFLTKRSTFSAKTGS